MGNRKGKTGRSATTDKCTQVRNLFDDTVRSELHDDTKTLAASIEEELSTDVAVALSPESDNEFTPDLKKNILFLVKKRESELGAMKQGLENEKDSVGSALEVIDEITDWIARADETPLFELGFDELRERYDKLVYFQERCETVVGERQEVLHSGTNRGAAGVRHHEMVAYLYQDMPTDYPVLYTVTRLNDLCEDCESKVCDHLSRSV